MMFCGVGGSLKAGRPWGWLDANSVQTPALVRPSPKLRLRLPPEPAARNGPCAPPKEQHKVSTGPTKFSRTLIFSGGDVTCPRSE